MWQALCDYYSLSHCVHATTTKWKTLDQSHPWFLILLLWVYPSIGEFTEISVLEEFPALYATLLFTGVLGRCFSCPLPCCLSLPVIFGSFQMLPLVPTVSGTARDLGSFPRVPPPVFVPILSFSREVLSASVSKALRFSLLDAAQSQWRSGRTAFSSTVMSI